MVLPLVLASASPRRLELLGRLGLTIIVAPANVDENQFPGDSPPLHALRVARNKAAAVALMHPGLPILAADTIVVLGDTILGKPSSPDQAFRMLRLLAGKTHRVLTAIALSWRGIEATHLAIAAVTFIPFEPELYRWYASTGEGLDKAGAYAVQGQGATLVERVEGNVQAVVGLPLAPLPGLLAKLGLRLVTSGNVPGLNLVDS